LHQPVGRHDIDDAPALAVGLDQVFEVERRLAEERVRALLLQGQETPLDGADAGGRDIPVLGLEAGGVLAHVLQHGAQILEVEQQESLVVRDLEHQGEHTALGLVEHQDAAQKQRAHLGDRGAQRMALLAEDVPEYHGITLEPEIAKVQALDAFLDLGVFTARKGQPREVALDVGHEDRHARGAELLGHGAQGDGLARAGGTGDESVPVGHLGDDADVCLGLGDHERIR